MEPRVVRVSAGFLFSILVAVAAGGGPVFARTTSGPESGEESGESAPAAEAKPAAGAPMLELKITGPSRAKVGGAVSFTLEIANVGKTAAKKLLVVDRFDAGLKHANGDSPIEHPLGDLACGASATVEISFEVTRGGTLSHTVEVTSEEKVVTSGRSRIQATGGDAKKGASPDAGPPKPLTPKPADEANSAAKSPFADVPFREPSDADQAQEKIPDLGPPLVDDLKGLHRLHPEHPIWIDKKTKKFAVAVGAVCNRSAPLELFACPLHSKEHESIVVLPIQPSELHAALLAVGAEAGAPVRFQPQYKAAHGTQIDIKLVWKDEKKIRRTAPAQEWIRDIKTNKSMEHPWVFGGSQFDKDPRSGREVYLADHSGYLICVSNFPTAVLDLPVSSTANNEELAFQAFTDRIPPLGTPVTLILTPRKKTTDARDAPKSAAGGTSPGKPKDRLPPPPPLEFDDGRPPPPPLDFKDLGPLPDSLSPRKTEPRAPTDKGGKATSPGEKSSKNSATPQTAARRGEDS